MGRWYKCGGPDTERKYHSLLFTSITTHFPVLLYELELEFETMKEIGFANASRVTYHKASQLVILRPFTLTINDMNKKPSLGSIHGLGPAISTSTKTGATDLMLSFPACDDESDASEVAAGITVSVQLRSSLFRY